MKNSEAVRLFVMFSYNFSQGFIQKVWKGSIADHLQSKFNSYYSRYGAEGVMQRFYIELDNENKELLTDWILVNYKG